MEETRSGYVEEVTYRNEENRYTVFVLSTEEGEKLTCVGFPGQIHAGDPCTVTGTILEHPVYGRQLRLTSFAFREPEGSEATLRYLGSGAVRGIGPALARRIVAAFGDDTMRILDEEPERLAEIRGISERGAREIAGRLESQKDERAAMVYLARYGIGGAQAQKIWDAYGMNLYEVLKENPYRLAEDIQGIGFLRADEIARRMGVRPDSEYRERSGILYTLKESIVQGNTCMGRETLLARAAELLQADKEELSIQLDNLAMDRKVSIREKEEGVFVFLMRVWQAEGAVARLLLDLDAAGAGGMKQETVEERIRQMEEEEKIRLDDLQKEAVRRAAAGGVMLLTGGPGTGKTTTINAIIRCFDGEEKPVLLAAPTGRAAKRMAEATGREAKTIHRLLEYHAADPDSEAVSAFAFEKDKDHPLEASAIIIDEMSMVDLWLFQSLLSAISPGTHLILVGDANQLPSVGPGSILQDLLESKAFRHVTLTKIFRQAATSDIVLNAHRILDGKPMVLDNKSSDFFFLPRSDPKVICKHLVVLMTQKLPPYVHAKPGDIQVLTPMKKGPLGAISLNRALQSVLNPRDPGRAEHEAHDTIFREGDRVMQMHNNYQLAWEVRGNFGMAIERGAGIFNGDFGVLQHIDSEQKLMTILFDENHTVEYPFEDLDDLELAYAVTVHKSQGSEYPAVLLPVLGGPKNLLSRNLLYTAVTRAKKCVVLIGSEKAFRDMEANTAENRRLTGLEDRIHDIQQASQYGAGSPLPEEMPDL